MNSSFLIAGAVISIVVILIVLIRNSVIGRKNEVENSYAGIDVQMTKRYDLIPNLVTAVKQYTEHEKDILLKLTELRTKAIKPGQSSNDKIKLDNQISSAMGSLLVSIENYPDLKASENFIHLQQSLNEVEEQLSAARRFYNSSVTNFNNSIEMFPTSIFASQLGYSRKELFIAPGHKKADLKLNELF